MLGVIGAWHLYKTRRDARKIAEDAITTRTRALHGDSDAEQTLGGMYYYGRGASQDYAQALQWYRKAQTKAIQKLSTALDTCTTPAKVFHRIRRWHCAGLNKL